MSSKKITLLDLIKRIEEKYEGKKLCQYYYSYLGNDEEGNDTKLLKEIISYHMKPQNTWKPFDPFLILDGRRSPIPDDLTGEEIKKLENCYQKINDAELKSRAADVLWLKKRDVQYAHDAVEAYLLSAKTIREESWTYPQDRIERALRLSLSLGEGGKDNFDKVTSHIKDILGRYDLEKEAYFPLKLTELLLEIKFFDKDLCIKVLNSCVDYFTEKGDDNRLSDYLEHLAKWYEKNGEDNKSKEKMILVAENYAKSKDSKDSYMEKAHVLQKAIAVYRQIGNEKKRIEELHKELLEVQKKIPDEMKTYEGEAIDTLDSIQAAIRHVSDISKKDALFRFCFVTKPINVKETFDLVEKQAQKFIHTSLFGKTTINGDGKTIGNTKGLVDSNGSREESLYPHLVDHMCISWDLSVQGAILPAKDQIMLEHEIREQDMVQFVHNNPLVRKGHEGLFIQGIMFGFHGQWDMAGNTLVIQFEDSLRFLLEKKGVLTSNLKDDFTQEERGTTYFFKNYSDEIKEIFGEDIFYELKALLVKDDNGNGFNLRNLVAHGLMSQNEFYSSVCIYFWWLVFRLICTPAIIFEAKSNEKNKKSSKRKKK